MIAAYGAHARALAAIGVLRYAMEAAADADIADRLVLSVRTVESHLYRAMQKLGISDRRDL